MKQIKVPGYQAVDVSPDFLRALKEYALSMGITTEEMKGVRDSRLLLIVYKAMMYDRMVEKKPGVQPGEKTRINMEAGGPVTGPGTARSDSIPAMLSNGEYVIPAHIVQAYGKDFFDKMLQSGKR